MRFFLFFIFLTPMIFIGCEDDPQLSESFAQCIGESDAIMYGTDWCSHCKNQKDEFGENFKYVNYVDCDRSSDVCKKEGIRSYPTWKINGAQYLGGQTPARLATLTGCEL
ncbi:thioredoxin domain-containing protein [Nanoarchaeota archaeon]